MSNAALFVEAVDTLIVLIQAAFGWLIFFAVTASILALAAVACGAWAVDAAWGQLWARRPQRGATRGRGAPNTPVRDSSVTEMAPEASQGPYKPSRSVPSWAHTDHHRWDEAA